MISKQNKQTYNQLNWVKSKFKNTNKAGHMKSNNQKSNRVKNQTK